LAGSEKTPRTPDDNSLFLARSLKYFQESVQRSGPAAAASYSLVAAILLFGGIGYALDLWWGTTPWVLLAGLLLGIVVGFYGLAKLVWPR
jgi:F0F1-type ATP synthase assembly protein I